MTISWTDCAHECSLQGPFLLSLRQSLELDTGVNHHSLALHFTARLRTRSPISAFHLPTPPLATLPINTILLFIQGHSSAEFSSNQHQITQTWKFLVILKTLISWNGCVKHRLHRRSFPHELGTLGQYSVCFHCRNQDLNKVPGKHLPLRKSLLRGCG